ncbi:Imidazole glycerol phosphate synthase hisHF, chloroplastic [Datura stramonium]|uniref:imidazole glycerol-phosphate synthase n=1 Tax=Datura stramonium TaxID=4076 RepID=A0ABS8S278_DATST|nr:Imidazole glycerol phosphate synthase hisHF, chloroplastic [Datura stramonium]
MAEALCAYIEQDRPFLGICLGLQLLFESSEENGPVKGLGLIPGVVGHENREWISSTCKYGDNFIASIRRGDVHAVQFHPEKSGDVGLSILRRFLNPKITGRTQKLVQGNASKLAKRVIACLDVRTNDKGDLVVTKGDQYDVREHTKENEVRNLGKPVDLAGQYYKDGADEVSFLNITAFRDFPLGDLPMLQVLRYASENVFVPLTVGGGIRDFKDGNGRFMARLKRALENTGVEHRLKVLSKYKVQMEKNMHGTSARWAVSGGREGRPIGAYELAKAVEELGAGEILLNCIDCDGQGKGFDIDLIKLISDAVSIPVIASSGAGAVEHFTEVFRETNASAALAAGIFHRKEVPIQAVKEHLSKAGIEVLLETCLWAISSEYHRDSFGGRGLGFPDDDDDNNNNNNNVPQVTGSFGGGGGGGGHVGPGGMDFGVGIGVGGEISVPGVGSIGGGGGGGIGGSIGRDGSVSIGGGGGGGMGGNIGNVRFGGGQVSTQYSKAFIFLILLGVLVRDTSARKLLGDAVATVFEIPDVNGVGFGQIIGGAGGGGGGGGFSGGYGAGFGNGQGSGLEGGSGGGGGGENGGSGYGFGIGQGFGGGGV